jgi:hypothetical protein
MRGYWCAVLAVGALCACSGGSSGNATIAPFADAGAVGNPPADAGTVAPPPDGGTVVTPPSDGGTVVTPPTDGGTVVTPPTDGGTGSNPPPADGGTVAADCQGVVPSSIGNPVTAQVSARDGEVCFDATSDGAGNVAAEAHTPVTINGRTTSISNDWSVFTAAGQLQGAVTGVWGDLFPQTVGFEGVLRRESPSGLNPPFSEFARASPSGDLSSLQVVGGDQTFVSTFRSWTSGLLVITEGCQVDPGAFTVRRFGEDGSAISSGSGTGGCAFLAAASAPGGVSLVLVSAFDGTGSATQDILGRWFSGDGTPLTGQFVLARATSPSIMLRTLANGEVAVQNFGHWMGVLDANGGMTLKSVPAWLADDHDFTIVRQGKAYARIPKTGTRNHLDLFSVQGNLCGTATFPGVGGLAIGADGTVIGASGANSCTKTWWSGLLK